MNKKEGRALDDIGNNSALKHTTVSTVAVSSSHMCNCSRSSTVAYKFESKDSCCDDKGSVWDNSTEVAKTRMVWSLWTINP